MGSTKIIGKINRPTAASCNCQGPTTTMQQPVVGGKFGHQFRNAPQEDIDLKFDGKYFTDKPPKGSNSNV